MRGRLRKVDNLDGGFVVVDHGPRLRGHLEPHGSLESGRQKLLSCRQRAKVADINRGLDAVDRLVYDR